MSGKGKTISEILERLRKPFDKPDGADTASRTRTR